MSYAEVATEMNILFRYIDNDLIVKIPNKFKEFLNSIASTTYISRIDPRFPLDEQYLLPDTEIMLAVLYCEYWAQSEDREEINSILAENDKKLNEKYCVDNIFGKIEEIKQTTEEQENKELAIITEELPWYKKLKNICKNILYKIFNINDE